MKPLALPLLLVLPVFSVARAATVVVAGFQSVHTGNAAALVSGTGSTTVNLSDTTGLTPGAPIRVTVAASEPLWTGKLSVGGGPSDLQWDAALKVIIGADSDADSVTWRLTGDFEPSDPVFGFGFAGGVIPMLELVVPWGTDLSAVVVEGMHSVQFAVGPGSIGPESTVKHQTLTVTTATVPEPATLASLLVGALACGFRRRRSSDGH